MNQQTFNLDGLEQNAPIDISLLTDSGRILYIGLCEIIGVKDLPSNGNEKDINKIGDKFNIIKIMDLLKEWLTASLKDRISNGEYDYMLLLRNATTYASTNSSINKDIYRARLEDPIKFHAYHKDNTIYEILREFLSNGGISINNHLKEIDEIINQGFLIDELKDAIDDCKKNGNTVYNIKYLHSI